ncbi:MAG TPA: helix-hairpin-helix domain-containing protein [Ignavibacteria bacterium]|nr:helix-hairpin-helix domain-containing protein [Ignavibacteria bacterium]
MSDWKRYLVFSKNEKIAVVFIIAIILIGSIIKLYSEVWSKQENTSINFEEFKDKLKIQLTDDSIKLFSKTTELNQDTLYNNFILIDLNTAGIEDLEKLPGIGESIASRIIEYRNQNGNFKKIEDIKKVKGVGEKKFNDIQKFIKVN